MSDMTFVHLLNRMERAAQAENPAHEAGAAPVTTLTNRAILLAAREVDVTCGACRLRALPTAVLGIVERVVSEEAIVRQVSGLVVYRCETPNCDAPAIPCEVAL